MTSFPLSTAFTSGRGVIWTARRQDGRTGEDQATRSVGRARRSRGRRAHCGSARDVLHYAVRQGLRPDNPAHGFVKFAEGRRDRRLTEDDYLQLGKTLSVAAQGDVWKAAVDATWLMILTGWRP